MTREPAQQLDAGHLAREYEEAISGSAAKPGEKFWEKRGGGGRRAGGRREEGGGISAAAAFTSVWKGGVSHHTHMA